MALWYQARAGFGYFLSFIQKNAIHTHQELSKHINLYHQSNYKTPQQEAFALQDLLSLIKLKEYLFSVLAINLIPKLSKPPARDAEIKANKIATFRVAYLLIFYDQGNVSLNSLIPIGHPKCKYTWVAVAFG